MATSNEEYSVYILEIGKYTIIFYLNSMYQIFKKKNIYIKNIYNDTGFKYNKRVKQ